MTGAPHRPSPSAPDSRSRSDHPASPPPGGRGPGGGSSTPGGRGPGGGPSTPAGRGPGGASSTRLALLKALLFALCLVPAALLAHGFAGDETAAAVFARDSGVWTMVLLLATLAVTPLRRLLGWHWLLRLRRMLGLFAFFYACLHAAGFFVLQHGFAPATIAEDALERPFVFAGFAAFLLLLPLAATSNAWAVSRLGGRRWQELHRSVYLVGLFACVHALWRAATLPVAAAAGETELPPDPAALPLALVFAALYAVLMLWRARARIAAYGPHPGVPAAKESTKPLRFFRQPPR